MEFVRQRGRSKEDGEALIQWALDRLHERRLRDQAASQDVEIFGVAASATQPAAPLVGGLVASGAITVRRQPWRRSRAQRKGQAGVVAGHYVLCAG
jgi:hypothetical protein